MDDDDAQMQISGETRRLQLKLVSQSVHWFAGCLNIRFLAGASPGHRDGRARWTHQD